MKPAAPRTAREILTSHLDLRRNGELEKDLEENYSPDLVILTGFGIFYGHEGMRLTAAILNEQLPDARFTYKEVVVDGEMGLLEWSGESDKTQVQDGADSYLVRDGRIVAQTIHYTVEPKQ